MPSLIQRGIAREAGGKLKITDSALKERFWRIARLQSKRRAKEKAKHISWGKQLLFPLLDIALNRINSGKKFDAKEMFIEYRSKGGRAGIHQFIHAIDLFKNAKTKEELFHLMERHRTFSDAAKDYWERLPKELKMSRSGQLAQARIEWWENLSLEEKEGLKRKILERQNLSFNRIALETREKIRKAVELDNKIKFIENANFAGKLKHYPGIPELMRSSWEAAYAKMLMKAGRTYIYEPIGFPMIDPRNGAIIAYHPDFIEFKPLKEKGFSARFTEVKGFLTDYGLKKIELFKKYYVDNDLSGLNEEQKRRMRHYIKSQRNLLFSYYRIPVNQKINFSVVGEKAWNPKTMEFNNRKGLIERIINRFPELKKEVSLIPSNTQLEKESKKASNGKIKLKKVEESKGRTRIGRKQTRIFQAGVANLVDKCTNSLITMLNSVRWTKKIEPRQIELWVMALIKFYDLMSKKEKRFYLNRLREEAAIADTPAVVLTGLSLTKGLCNLFEQEIRHREEPYIKEVTKQLEIIKNNCDKINSDIKNTVSNETYVIQYRIAQGISKMYEESLKEKEEEIK
ncbi:MAG: hypothetical protein AB1467_06080 [Candidatus Diapherotrites archaeon]